MDDKDDSPQKGGRGSGRSIWTWVLGLTGLGVLLLLVIPAIISSLPSQPTVGVGGGLDIARITTTITDINDITQNSDQSGLVGSRIILISIPVQQVLTDRLFFVGTDNNRLLVYSNNPIIALNVGSMVDIDGQVQPVPPSDQVQQMWNPDTNDLPAIIQQQVYINTTGVDT